MSSTNKTSNYNLSQFLGSDKPAWLSDYNQDMTKIDTQMKANADAATGADGKADANATAIGTLANLNTTAKTDLVSAINEVDATATTASTTAGTAASDASNALTNLAKFNLTSHSDLTPTTSFGSIGSGSYVRFATDSTSSIFKLYGRLYVNMSGSTSTRVTVTIGTTSLRPAEAYTIEAGAIYWRYFSTGYQDINVLSLTIGTDGVITCEFNRSDPNHTSALIMLPPCLYFNTDFGDIAQDND